jgi:hypothetical protein
MPVSSQNRAFTGFRAAETRNPGKPRRHHPGQLMSFGSQVASHGTATISSSISSVSTA